MQCAHYICLTIGMYGSEYRIYKKSNAHWTFVNNIDIRLHAERESSVGRGPPHSTNPEYNYVEIKKSNLRHLSGLSMLLPPFRRWLSVSAVQRSGHNKVNDP